MSKIIYEIYAGDTKVNTVDSYVEALNYLHNACVYIKRKEITL
jgi:hypothetical protein